jgi:hypothetical protein
MDAAAISGRQIDLGWQDVVELRTEGSDIGDE